MSFRGIAVKIVGKYTIPIKPGIICIFSALRRQLTAVEKYALHFIENSERFWKESQLAAADAEIQNQQKEFDAKKLEEMTEALGTGTSTPGGSSIATSEADTNSR